MVPGRTYTPSVILRLVWKRRWLITLPLVVFTGTAVTISRLLPDLYRAQTTILVTPQRVPEAYVRTTVTTRLEDQIRTISEQILSTPSLERIITEFGLYPEESKTLLAEQVVARMKSQVGIQVVRADSFSISFTYNDPKTAAKVTERLAASFAEENGRDRESQAESTRRFLDAELDEARRRLIEHDKGLEAYRREHSGSLPNQLPSNLQFIQSSNQQITVLNEASNRLRDRRASLTRQIEDLEATLEAGVPVTPVPQTRTADPTVVVPGGTLVQQLDVARQNLETLRIRLQLEHPDVQRVMRQIADLEAKLRAVPPVVQKENALAVPAVVPPALIATRNRLLQAQADRRTIDSQVAHNESEVNRLTDLVARYQARLEELPRRESELAELTRDYATLQTNYQGLLAKREESVVAANLERRQVGSQFRVVDPARPPQLPVSPNRFLINSIGAALGLLLGLGTAVLLELLDTTLRTEEEVGAALGIATLALVPTAMSVTDTKTARKRRVMRVAIGTVAVLASGGAAAWWWFASGMGQ